MKLSQGLGHHSQIEVRQEILTWKEEEAEEEDVMAAAAEDIIDSY
jgi:hypothetical protein